MRWCDAQQMNAGRVSDEDTDRPVTFPVGQEFLIECPMQPSNRPFAAFYAGMKALR